MKSSRLENMVKGWFVGAFSPTAYSTEACEVAVKHYKAGDRESAHYHKVATEITLIVSGVVRMADREWQSGDIIIIEPGDITDFEAITDTINVVVKVPGALHDKYTAS
jgi:quercetin dioxygenase-like cupin family protein